MTQAQGFALVHHRLHCELIIRNTIGVVANISFHQQRVGAGCVQGYHPGIITNIVRPEDLIAIGINQAPVGCATINPDRIKIKLLSSRATEGINIGAGSRRQLAIDLSANRQGNALAFIQQAETVGTSLVATAANHRQRIVAGDQTQGQVGIAGIAIVETAPVDQRALRAGKAPVNLTIINQ